MRSLSVALLVAAYDGSRGGGSGGGGSNRSLALPEGSLGSAGLIAVDLVVKRRQVLVGRVTIGLLVQLLAKDGCSTSGCGGGEWSRRNQVARLGAGNCMTLAATVKAEVGKELLLVIESLDRVHGDGPLPQARMVIVIKGKQVHGGGKWRLLKKDSGGSD